MRFWLTIFLAFIQLTLFAQQNLLEKFGAVQLSHFYPSTYAIDSHASAVVLFDKGHTKIEGNSKGWFSASFVRHKVLRVLTKDGLDEANIELLLLKKGKNEEKLEELKAVTYNLHKGKLKATKLERKDVYRRMGNKEEQVIRFAMPDVREGSIIEFEYTVTSDYYWQIDPWYFQSHLPTLWSEYVFSVPQFFTYTFLYHGYQPFWISEKRESRGQFVFTSDQGVGPTQRTNFSAAVTDFRWVKKDVAPFKEEVFTSSPENNIAKIEFSLASQTEPLEPRDFRNTWQAIVEELEETENFGKAIDDAEAWLKNEVSPIIQDVVSQKEKAAKIYRFVRDHFFCTNDKGIAIETPLKKVWLTKRGSVAEINLLLLAMLRSAEIEAVPVLLSRTMFSRVHDNFPNLSRFNYLVVQAVPDEQKILLDASRKLGFGKLLDDCYNGPAFIVNEEGSFINLVADSLEERKTTLLTFGIHQNGAMIGQLKKTPGYFESYAIRKSLREKSPEALEKMMARNASAGLIYEATTFDSLDNLDGAVTLQSKVKWEYGTMDIVSIDPLFGEGVTQSPFGNAERLHPVEMPYAINETYVLNFVIPPGYGVAELPKQLMAKLDGEGKSFFEYRIDVTNGVISLRSTIKLARASFEPEEYESLRQFFNLIVSKHSERIVLKKS